MWQTYYDSVARSRDITKKYTGSGIERTTVGSPGIYLRWVIWMKYDSSTTIQEKFTLYIHYILCIKYSLQRNDHLDCTRFFVVLRWQGPVLVLVIQFVWYICCWIQKSEHSVTRWLLYSLKKKIDLSLDGWNLRKGHNQRKFCSSGTNVGKTFHGWLQSQGFKARLIVIGKLLLDSWTVQPIGNYKSFD